MDNKIAFTVKSQTPLYKKRKTNYVWSHKLEFSFFYYVTKHAQRQVTRFLDNRKLLKNEKVPLVGQELRRMVLVGLANVWLQVYLDWVGSIQVRVLSATYSHCSLHTLHGEKWATRDLKLHEGLKSSLYLYLFFFD